MDFINKIPNIFAIFKISGKNLNDFKFFKANKTFYDFLEIDESEALKKGFESIFKPMKTEWFTFILNAVRGFGNEFDCESADGSMLLKTYFVEVSHDFFL